MRDEYNEKRKGYTLKYLSTHREVGNKLTNNWRATLKEGQKIVGYTDLTLMSFKKEKLILLIRKLEEENERLSQYEPKDNKIKAWLKKFFKDI